jgi:competence protein ComEA
MNTTTLRRFVGAALLAAFVLSVPAFAAAAPAGKVNLNTATVAQLEELPGIGPSLAARIVEHRQKNGAFKSVEDLMAVRGIGEKNFSKIQSYLTVGAAQQPAKETPKQ